MDEPIWIFWLIAGLIFIVAEVFTLGFVLFWFGIGALAAVLVALSGGGLVLQFIVFAGVSAVLTIMSRKFAVKYLPHGANETKLGADSLPGQMGTVVTASKGALLASAVKVYGSTWTAFPADGVSEFNEGEKVEVVSVKGSSILVRRVSDELPEWRGG